MTADHAIILRDITANVNGALAAIGFGVFMATVAAIFLMRTGIGRSRWALFFLMFYVAFFCICMSMWAQSLRVDRYFDWDPEVVKAVGDIAKKLAWVAAAVAVAAFGARIVARIVERAPPSALVACLALLLGCGLCGAVAIFTPFHNLIVIASILGILALVAIVAILAWATVRINEASIANPRQQHITIQAQPASPRIAVQDRGQLLAAPRKSGLPAKRNPFENWRGGGAG